MSEPIRLNGAGRPRRPAASELELRFSDRAVEELAAIRTHYPNAKACILPALWIAQREYGGWLPEGAIAEVAHRLQRSYAEVEGVATFYTLYNTSHRPGRHKLELCTCLSCQVCGTYRIRDLIYEKLGIRNGETTEDGIFTLEEVECLNACDRAPVMMVGDSYHGPLDEAGLDALLEKLRKTEESTVIRYADEVVQAHLSAKERK